MTIKASALFLLLVLGACSSSQKSEIKAPSSTPEWVNDPMSACSEMEEICGSSMGEGQIIADGNARKSIALVFESKITSTMTSSKTARQESGAAIDGKTNEFYSSDLTESTDQMLEGVEIKKRFQDKDGYYALASLNKVKAAKRLASLIKEIDEKLIPLNKENKKTNFGKMRKFYLDREVLNARHEFLVGRRVQSSVSYEDILKKKNISLKNNLVFIKTKDEAFMPMVLRLVTERGFKIAKDSAKADLELVANVESKKEYLNVNGFEKYLFTIALNSADEKGEKLGAIEFSVMGVGRSFDQAKEKVRPDIERFIEDHFDELNLE